MAQDAGQKPEDVKEAVKETMQQVTNVTALPTASAPQQEKSSEAKSPEPAAKTPASQKKKPSKKKKAPSSAKAKQTAAKPAEKAQAFSKKAAPAFHAFGITMERISPQSTIFNPNPMMETMMSQSTAQFDKFAADAAKMSRDNMDAFVKSGTLFAKGFEEMSRTAIAMSQSAAEKQAELAQAALSSKTINEFAETQSKMAQASFDDFMQGATKISEMSVKLLTDASAPLNEQINKAMQKVNKAA